MQGLVCLVQARISLSLALDDGLQLGDVLVHQLVLLFGGADLLPGHLGLEFALVVDLEHFRLQLLNLLLHILVGRLELLLQACNLDVLGVCQGLEFLRLLELHRFKPLVFLE